MTGTQPDQDALLKEYVLGGLTPAQREEIDERLLVDPDFHADVRSAGDDVIHAYLSDELPGADRERFESFFLASPRRQERVAFMRSLLAAAQGSKAGRASAATAAPRRRPLAVVLAWAAVLVVAVAGGGWAVGERRLRERSGAEAQAREASLREEVAEKNRRVSELEGLEEPATWTLKSSVERGPGTADAIRPRGAWIRLRAPLAGIPRQPAYRASVQTVDGREVFQASPLREASAAGERVLEVMVPSAVLDPGTYLLAIQLVSGSHDELTAAPFDVR